MPALTLMITAHTGNYPIVYNLTPSGIILIDIDAGDLLSGLMVHPLMANVKLYIMNAIFAFPHI